MTAQTRVWSTVNYVLQSIEDETLGLLLFLSLPAGPNPTQTSDRGPRCPTWQPLGRSIPSCALSTAWSRFNPWAAVRGYLLRLIEGGDRRWWSFVCFILPYYYSKSFGHAVKRVCNYQFFPPLQWLAGASPPALGAVRPAQKQTPTPVISNQSKRVVSDLSLGACPQVFFSFGVSSFHSEPALFTKQTNECLSLLPHRLIHPPTCCCLCPPMV